MQATLEGTWPPAHAGRLEAAANHTMTDRDRIRLTTLSSCAG
jgi:hypothetical protein